MKMADSKAIVDYDSMKDIELLTWYEHEPSSYLNVKANNGLPENIIAKGNLSRSKHILVSKSSTATDMCITHDLFIIFPILRSTLWELRNTHCYNMFFQHTLFTDIFHSSSQLILKKLTFLCNLFSFLQEVLGGSLHRCCQHMSLLGASFLLVRWAFVAGINQSGDLWQGCTIIQLLRHLVLDLNCICEA